MKHEHKPAEGETVAAALHYAVNEVICNERKLTRVDREWVVENIKKLSKFLEI